jgi:hypothetical protein
MGSLNLRVEFIEGLLKIVESIFEMQVVLLKWSNWSICLI